MSHLFQLALNLGHQDSALQRQLLGGLLGQSLVAQHDILAGRTTVPGTQPPLSLHIAQRFSRQLKMMLAQHSVTHFQKTQVLEQRETM